MEVNGPSQLLGYSWFCASAFHKLNDTVRAFSLREEQALLPSPLTLQILWEKFLTWLSQNSRKLITNDLRY